MADSLGYLRKSGVHAMTVIGAPAWGVWFQLKADFTKEVLDLIRCLYRTVLMVYPV